MEQLDNYWRFQTSKQKTLRQPIWCRGVCLHSGLISEVHLVPSDVNTGIVFHLMNDAGKLNSIVPATIDYTHSGMLRTVLKNDNATVETTEHLLAALSAYGIRNLIIKVWGNEVPIFEGSANSWAFLIDCAGVIDQDQDVSFIKVIKSVVVTQGNSWCRLDPYEGHKFTYEISYDHPMIGDRVFSIDVTKNTFDKELSKARTFGFFKDFEAIQSHGLAKGASLKNTVVFYEDGLMKMNMFWDDEPVRHKVVDAIGDLSLAGFPIIGKFYGYRSGHELNQQLVKTLLIDKTSWIKSSFLNI